MKIHKGEGAPSVKTVGAIGDKYIDVNTGNQYKCTFTYSSSSGQSEYWWKLQKEEVDIPNVETVLSAQQINVVEEQFVTPVVDEVTKESEPEPNPDVNETVEKADAPVRENIRTNYRQHYDKRKK